MLFSKQQSVVLTTFIVCLLHYWGSGLLMILSFGCCHGFVLQPQTTIIILSTRSSSSFRNIIISSKKKQQQQQQQKHTVVQYLSSRSQQQQIVRTNQQKENDDKFIKNKGGRGSISNRINVKERWLSFSSSSPSSLEDLGSNVDDEIIKTNNEEESTIDRKKISSKKMNNNNNNTNDVLTTITPLHAKNNETVVASISLIVPHSLVVADDDDDDDESPEDVDITTPMTKTTTTTTTILNAAEVTANAINAKTEIAVGTISISKNEQNKISNNIVPSTSVTTVIDDVSISIPPKDDVTTTSTTTTTTKNEIPTYRQLILFCSTTFLIWLSEPLLSLVDTTVVGLTQQNAVIQLASLGPATTLIDSIMYLTYFLAIATTTQIAPARAMKDYKKLQTVTSHVLGVAAVMGLACTTFVWVMAKPVLTNMAGLSGSPELIAFATAYAKIRASVAICNVGGMTMQAVCLATLNTRTPSIAVLAASITNIIGDIVLRQYGVIGAAIATAASSVVSSSILFISVRKCFQEWKRKEIKQYHKQKQKQLQRQQILHASSSSLSNPTTVNGNEVVSNSDPITSPEVIVAADPNVKAGRKANRNKVIRQEKMTVTDVICEGTKKSIPMISLPDHKAAFDLVKLSGPIFFVIMSKIACYSAMTIRCTDFGVAALAAHSIMMRIFFFYGCFGDSLSQTAQSFLPATLYPQPNPKNFRIILRRLLIMAGTIGMVNRICTINILTHLGKYLTKYATIIQLMKDHTHFIGFAILLHPFIVLLEGTVLASRDFPTLIKTYTTTLPLHFTILKFFSGSFPEVWRTFFFVPNYSVIIVWRTGMEETICYKRTRIAKCLHPLTFPNCRRKETTYTTTSTIKFYSIFFTSLFITTALQTE